MEKPIKIGFVINPIAGMGGRVGLKGTDSVVDQARQLGAVPVAEQRARHMLKRLKGLIDRDTDNVAIDWITCAGQMGLDALTGEGFFAKCTLHTPGVVSGQSDTRIAVQKFKEAKVDLIVFCGGDGTARDIGEGVGEDIPILGIPSGVKMYSGVFGHTPRQTAEVLFRFIQKQLDLVRVDILDLDEDAYRLDEWVVKMYQPVLTPFARSFSQLAKSIVQSQNDTATKTAIAEVIASHMKEHLSSLYFMGPGSTLQLICQRIGLDKTLLGIDAVSDQTTIAKNVNEARIMALCEQFSSCFIVVSPIGAQGFVLGRGNLQVSPAVLRRIGLDRLLIVATPAKLATIKSLHFDTGDDTLDRDLCAAGYREVIVGAGRYRMVPCPRPDL